MNRQIAGVSVNALVLSMHNRKTIGCPNPDLSMGRMARSGSVALYRMEYEHHLLTDRTASGVRITVKDAVVKYHQASGVVYLSTVLFFAANPILFY
jgi:hypothetical protein